MKTPSTSTLSFATIWCLCHMCTINSACVLHRFRQSVQFLAVASSRRGDAGSINSSTSSSSSSSVSRFTGGFSSAEVFSAVPPTYHCSDDSLALFGGDADGSFRVCCVPSTSTNAAIPLSEFLARLRPENRAFKIKSTGDATAFLKEGSGFGTRTVSFSRSRVAFVEGETTGEISRYFALA